MRGEELFIGLAVMSIAFMLFAGVLAPFNPKIDDTRANASAELKSFYDRVNDTTTSLSELTTVNPTQSDVDTLSFALGSVTESIIKFGGLILEFMTLPFKAVTFLYHYTIEILGLSGTPFEGILNSFYNVMFVVLLVSGVFAVLYFIMGRRLEI